MATYFTPILADPNQIADADTFNDPMVELDLAIVNANAAIDDANAAIGDLAALGTETKTSLVAALGSAGLLTDYKDKVIPAINEVYTRVVAAQADIDEASAGYASLNARLDTMDIMGSNVSTNANGAASAGQKNITVDSTAGFLIGAPIAYELVGGVIETNWVASITPTTLLVVENNIGAGGIADDGYIVVITPNGIINNGTVLGNLALLQSGNYRGSITFDTTGAMVAAPWSIQTMSAGTSDHDNVLLTTYNLKHNRQTGRWERVVSGEHGIRFGMESRWTTADPSTERGLFEWNLQIERALTGALLFDRAPFYLSYDFDNSKLIMTLGDDADTNNSLTVHAFLTVDKKDTVNDFAFRVRNGSSWFEDEVAFYKRARFQQSSVISGANAVALDFENNLAPDNLGAAIFVNVASNTIGSGALRVQEANGIKIAGATWTSGTSDIIITATDIHLTVPTIGLYNAGLTIGSQNDIGNFAILSSSVNPSSLAGSLGLGTVAPATRLDLAAGAITMSEMAAPAAPAANGVVIYAVDNGGKTQLMARFPSGVAQQIAIEP